METEAFFSTWPAALLFRAKLACPTKSTREVGATMMTGRKFLSPPLLWLAPQSDHGSAACAETEAFFQHGPLQSFFKFNSTGSPCNRHVRGKLAQRLTTGRKFLRPPLMARSAVRSRERGPPQSDCGGGRLARRNLIAGAEG